MNAEFLLAEAGYGGRDEGVAKGFNVVIHSDRIGRNEVTTNISDGSDGGSAGAGG